jgi:hypothetical protein
MAESTTSSLAPPALAAFFAAFFALRFWYLQAR